jgi:membrane-associated phospholipid phosphatase
MATGNHFWLDIVAGIVVAALSAGAIYRKPLWRRLRAVPATA